ncbi:MAG TPA: hypothetical protein VMW52_13475, partial [Phycisphaerae bacterium]|nr:hypothetical protein [Phycisphaerae bacterium]
MPAVSTRPSPAAARAFQPTDIGDELWAWGWAGARSENLILKDGPRGKVIDRMGDLSGRGHDFVGVAGQKPAWQAGLNVPAGAKGGPYRTDLPVIGLDRYQGGSQVYGNVFRFDEAMNAAAGFYVAAVFTNTRAGGVRELLGLDARNCLRIDQQRNRVEVVIAGQRATLGAKDSLPAGEVVLELWREASMEVVCAANGHEIGRAKLPGAFTLAGLGYDGTGSSQWDDHWMEFVLCDKLPAATERAAILACLAARWGVALHGSPRTQGDTDASLRQAPRP